MVCLYGCHTHTRTHTPNTCYLQGRSYKKVNKWFFITISWWLFVDCLLISAPQFVGFLECLLKVSGSWPTPHQTNLTKTNCEKGPFKTQATLPRGENLRGSGCTASLLVHMLGHYGSPFGIFYRSCKIHGMFVQTEDFWDMSGEVGPETMKNQKEKLILMLCTNS